MWVSLGKQNAVIKLRGRYIRDVKSVKKLNIVADSFCLPNQIEFR